MQTNKVDLYKYFNLTRPDGADGYLTECLIDKYDYCPNRLRPAMIVVGGGDYWHISAREQEPVALYYMNNGFNTFVLHYSVKPISYPYQLIEGAMAVAYVRENAQRLGIDKDKIAAIGFSAGAHLTAMIGTLYKDQNVVDALKEKASLCKLNALILSYPVITSDERYCHAGSINNIVGLDKGEKTQQIREYLSLENAVTSDCPPAFIWGTADDVAVPVENSLFMAMAYRKAGVPFELHTFKSGVHGLSLATDETVPCNVSVQPWAQLSITWLKDYGFVIKD